jgi:large subunit ribosomal protein L10
VFSDTGVIVVAHYSGLTVAQMTALRGRMRDAGAGVKVAKNRLAKLALKETDNADISDLFTGRPSSPTRNGSRSRRRSPSSSPRQRTRSSWFSAARWDDRPRRGQRQGARHAAVAGRAARATLVGMLKQPATRIASGAAGSGVQLARVLSAYAEKSAA